MDLTHRLVLIIFSTGKRGTLYYTRTKMEDTWLRARKAEAEIRKTAKRTALQGECLVGSACMLMCGDKEDDLKCLELVDATSCEVEQYEKVATIQNGLIIPVENVKADSIAASSSSSSSSSAAVPQVSPATSITGSASDVLKVSDLTTGSQVMTSLQFSSELQKKGEEIDGENNFNK
jgi:hypothetical protein